MNLNARPVSASGQVSGQPTVKYHRDFYYLGKCILRLGISIMVITLVAKLAFGGISPVLLIVLSAVSVLLVIIGIIRITCSYSALRRSRVDRPSTDSNSIATISNFQAFIRNHSNNRQNASENRNQTTENIHCGNRSFGSPSLVLPPSYEPPPSYEQIQKDLEKADQSQTKSQ